jgi:hypothetical protein
MKPREEAVTALKPVADGVVAAVNEAGEQAARANLMYLAFQAHGM